MKWVKSLSRIRKVSLTVSLTVLFTLGFISAAQAKPFIGSETNCIPTNLGYEICCTSVYLFWVKIGTNCDTMPSE